MVNEAREFLRFGEKSERKKSNNSRIKEPVIIVQKRGEKGRAWGANVRVFYDLSRENYKDRTREKKGGSRE